METWLRESVSHGVVHISDFTVVKINAHGGVCMYIKDGDFKKKQLKNL